MAEGTDFPLPPPDFSFLVESMLMQTQVQLGLLHFGDSEAEAESEPEPNLALARHSIDLLAMLQEKTKGNLSAEEQRLLENGLTELRFRFVQVVEEQKRKSDSRTSAAAAEDAPRIITSDGGKGSKTS